MSKDIDAESPIIIFWTICIGVIVFRRNTKHLYYIVSTIMFNIWKLWKRTDFTNTDMEVGQLLKIIQKGER